MRIARHVFGNRHDVLPFSRCRCLPCGNLLFLLRACEEKVERKREKKEIDKGRLLGVVLLLVEHPSPEGVKAANNDWEEGAAFLARAVGCRLP